jgi:hypothetical protein
LPLSSCRAAATWSLTAFAIVAASAIALIPFVLSRGS